MRNTGVCPLQLVARRRLNVMSYVRCLSSYHLLNSLHRLVDTLQVSEAVCRQLQREKPAMVGIEPEISHCTAPNRTPKKILTLLVFLLYIKNFFLHSVHLVFLTYMWKTYFAIIWKTLTKLFVPKEIESAAVYVTHRAELCNSVEHRADKSKLSLAGHVFLNGNKRIRNFSVENS